MDGVKWGKGTQEQKQVDDPDAQRYPLYASQIAGEEMLLNICDEEPKEANAVRRHQRVRPASGDNDATGNPSRRPPQGRLYP